MSDPQAPQPGATEARAPAPGSQQMEAQQPLRVKPQGYAAAFSGTSGAAWVVRDLASI